MMGSFIVLRQSLKYEQGLVIHRGEMSIDATEAKLVIFSASEGGSLLLPSQKVNMADKNDIDQLVFM